MENKVRRFENDDKQGQENK